jgi:hypothetical protein
MMDEAGRRPAVIGLGDEVGSLPPHLGASTALLLDNKPSNHTDEVRVALGDVTIPIRATTHRRSRWAVQRRALQRARHRTRDGRRQAAHGDLTPHTSDSTGVRSFGVEAV